MNEFDWEELGQIVGWGSVEEAVEALEQNEADSRTESRASYNKMNRVSS